jgi:hypothetical protein
MSCRKFLGVSIAVKNTTIGFKIEEISKFHSVSFSESQIWAVSVHINFRQPKRQNWILG